MERSDDRSRNAHGGLVNIHPILTKRPGERFEARVVRSRPLTPTTHGIELEKPAHFTFQTTQFTFLQLETSTGLDRAADLPTIMGPLTRMEPTMGLTG
jgi:hypothetical protein